MAQNQYNEMVILFIFKHFSLSSPRKFGEMIPNVDEHAHIFHSWVGKNPPTKKIVYVSLFIWKLLLFVFWSPVWVFFWTGLVVSKLYFLSVCQVDTWKIHKNDIVIIHNPWDPNISWGLSKPMVIVGAISKRLAWHVGQLLWTISCHVRVDYPLEEFHWPPLVRDKIRDSCLRWIWKWLLSVSARANFSLWKHPFFQIESQRESWLRWWLARIAAESLQVPEGVQLFQVPC